MKCLFVLSLSVLLFSCKNENSIPLTTVDSIQNTTSPGSIGQIPLPVGFRRTADPPASFAAWLRDLTLKQDKTVYLYNGFPKKNQLAQYAVLQLPRSNTDLQQCADVVMRLRAEYLFHCKRYDEILFTDFDGRQYAWKHNNDRKAFELYLNNVFGFCGSASLEKQLTTVADFSSIEPGDVLIRGGFPGHAVIVADLAVNDKGEKIFMLIQGYQPAQDIHVLVNPMDKGLSPWYKMSSSDTIYTPEWVFYRSQLRRW
jgi:hypothetical protein